jgi:hypothetical protein
MGKRKKRAEWFVYSQKKRKVKKLKNKIKKESCIRSWRDKTTLTLYTTPGLLENEQPAAPPTNLGVSSNYGHLSIHPHHIHRECVEQEIEKGKQQN